MDFQPIKSKADALLATQERLLYSRDSGCVPWAEQTSASLHRPVHLCDVMMCGITADNLFSRASCPQTFIYEAACHCVSSVPIVSDSMRWPNSLQWVHHTYPHWVISPSDRPLSAPILLELCSPRLVVMQAQSYSQMGPCWKLVSEWALVWVWWAQGINLKLAG